MNIEQLTAEARRLARPCVHLTQDEGAPLAAIWGGPGLVENQVEPSCSTSGFCHWFSLDCRFLPPGYEDLRACLSVYVEEDRWSEGDEWPEDEEPDEWPAVVARDETIQMPDYWVLPGTKLFAHPRLSWPPVDAVFRFGSPAIQEWLADCGWQADWLYNDNFRDSAVVSVYESYVNARNPLFDESEKVFVRLGGWHDAFPENDWVELLAKRLVAMTYRDAQPWLEVWADQSRNFEVLQRIT